MSDGPPPACLLVKVSGGALGSSSAPLDRPSIDRIVERLRPLVDAGLRCGLVVGGGNLLRGAKNTSLGMDRQVMDRMGMLGTLVNGLALAEALGQAGIESRVMCSIPMTLEGVEPFTKERALELMARGGLPIFAGGTGHPFFSTDTGAVLRALQIGADMIVKASRVDGVYDKDPEKHTDARRFDRMDFDQVLDLGLEVMDLSAVALCREHSLPIVVLDLESEDSLRSIAEGRPAGTLVTTRKED